MVHMKCSDMVSQLLKAVVQSNTELTDNMTHENNTYDYVCVKSDVTFDFFYNCLKNKWTAITNTMEQNSGCAVKLRNVMALYAASQEVINKQALSPSNAVDALVAYSKQLGNTQFQMDMNVQKTMESMLVFFNDHCSCQLPEIFDAIIIKYHVRLTNKQTQEQLKQISETYVPQIMDMIKKKIPLIIDKTDEQISQIMGDTEVEPPKIIDMSQEFKQSQTPHTQPISGEQIDAHQMNLIIREQIGSYFTGKTFDVHKELRDKYVLLQELIKQHDMNNIVNLTNLKSFSVRNELEKLIPNELGSLKDFFVKVISHYYENLHPIIWASIFKGIGTEIFKELPITKNEFYAFFARQFLLNSGPFILKILQMIRPILSDEMIRKYNLGKLSYPLLTDEQVQIVMDRAMIDSKMYTKVIDISASVGHVRMLKDIRTNQKVILKIIKPISIAQSCWEYSSLSTVYEDKESCEHVFLTNILKSNGVEMNVQNEIDNIKTGKKIYTCTYNEVFGADINVTLTTVDVPLGVVRKDCWYAMSMSVAPGLPVSKAVESDELKSDTKYQAKLHRCLDLLLYKFFFNVINNGFYHGDLHAGNMFFSYVHNQMTLIDFGAVGHIDMFSNENYVTVIREIIMMSIYHNFDGILDVMTQLINTKCPKTQIDTNTDAYKQFRQSLVQKKLDNIRNAKRAEQISDKFEKEIFSRERLMGEKSDLEAPSEKIVKIESIYSYYDMDEPKKETIIENQDENIVKPTIATEQEVTTSFANIMAEIIKFYAINGVNIAIKFNELYEFQKAYSLVLGVLKSTNYNPHRIGIAMKKAIVNLQHAKKLLNITVVVDMVKTWWKEYQGYKKTKKQVTNQ